MSDRDRRLDALLDRALDLDADGRAALLTEAGELRADLEEMLALHARMDRDFLETPAGERLRPGAFEPGEVVGRYTVRALVGTGGSGTVYEADQQRPRRTVALKVMSAHLASERALQRFLEEAEILARLEHPHIAHVYDAGVHEGVPYIAMELVEGARGIDEHDGPLDERLALLADVCDAVHSGHLKGVLHRDLKPGNILLRDGRPTIVDFGIARMEGAAGGEIAGTPRYMSPEQRDPRGPLDARSDVFSLGVVLDELLPGARDADLAAIVAKARAKRPEDRYASASALGEDLRRYRRVEPVAARQASWPHHARLFARRHRGLTLALVGLALAVAVGVAVSIHFAVRAGRAQGRAEQQAYVATLAAAASALRLDDVAEARAQLARSPAHLRGWEWRHLHRRAHPEGRALREPGIQIGSGSVAAGLLAWTGSGATTLRVRSLADGAPVYSLARGAERLVSACALAPDGTRVAHGDTDGVVTVRALPSGAPLWSEHPARSRVWALAYAPDGDRFAAATLDGFVRVWSNDGRVLRKLRHEGRAYAVAFSPDGARLYTGGRTDRAIRAWDLATGTELWSAHGHEGNVESLAPSPDGATLVSGSMDDTVRIWNAATGRPIRTLRGHRRGVKSVAYAPDGTMFASGALDRTVRVWAPDGRAIAKLQGHASQVRVVAYVEGGARLVSFGREGEIRIRDARDPPAPPELPGVMSAVHALWFEDGELVAASREGAVVRLDPATRRETARTPPQGRATTCVGRIDGRLVTGDVDGLLRDGGGASWRAHPPGEAVVAVGGRGELLATAPANGRVRLWRGRALLRTVAHRSPARSLLFDHDGRRLFVGQVDGAIAIVDVATGEVRSELRGHSAGAMGLALSPDGARLASASHDGTVRVWHLGWRAQLLVLYGHRIYANSVAWSADGRTLASGGGADLPEACTIRLWESE